MKTNVRRNLIQTCLLAALLALPAVVQAQFTYITNNGAIAITGYAGPPWAVTIPTNINGLPVTSIVDFAFDGTSLTGATIPEGVVNIGGASFEGCTNLMSVLIGNSVAKIGNYTFDGCINLAHVTIGDSVTNIGYFAFNGCISLTSVTIPSTVTSIIDYAFLGCFNLTSIYFKGNAPVADWTVFLPQDGFDSYFASAYYLPDTTGWSDFSANTGIPALPWLPLIQTTGDTSFGVRTNQFGFNITWAGGQTVVVEACTNLANPVWFPVATNTLASDSVYFSDPQSSNVPARFYRLRAP